MRTEFEFIQHIKKKYNLKHIGDDCAVLPKDAKTDMLFTADMLVEDVDFRVDWTTPELLGNRALSVSLSDIAAMGGEPRWAMLSIGVPENIWNSGFVEQFYEGVDLVVSTFRAYGMEGLIGGDISRTPDKLVIDSVVCGEVPKGTAVLRSGAKPGDSIYVTGEVGGAAAGLRLLHDGRRCPDSNGPRFDALLLRQLNPFPHIADGVFLRRKKIASAMIDLSDGISSDLAHICSQSGVGAVVYAESLPVHRKLKRIFRSADEQLEMALNGGEDFELLFTADDKKIPPDALAGFYRIGEATANVGIIELIREGKSAILEPKGYRHF